MELLQIVSPNFAELKTFGPKVRSLLAFFVEVVQYSHGKPVLFEVCFTAKRALTMVRYFQIDGF